MPIRVTIPERVRTGFSFGELSARSTTSTYRRIERVLTSSPPHGGWRAFIFENISITISLISGLLLCLSAYAYTRNISTHLLVCPDWARDCQIRPYITWNANNLALVQGLVTVTFSVGLMLMICSVRKTAESALWPILTRHPLSFDQIEAYLSVTRGQVFAPRPAIHMLRWNHAATFLLTTVSVFIMSLVVAPLIGFVFELSDIPRQFETMYQIGSGTDRTFRQTSPPSSIDIDAMVEYQSWSKNYTREPMPEYRDWIVDRTKLSNFHSIQAFAIRTVVNIECDGHDLDDYEVLTPDRVRFSTTLDRNSSGGKQSDNDSSDGVEVSISQYHPALAVWINDFQFLNANKSSASLIFAEFNGTIEQGSQSKLSGKLLAKALSVSAVVCNIEVELRDELLQLGNGNQSQSQTQQNIPILSSTSYVSSPSQNTTNNSNTSSHTLNELALWLAVAPVLVGPSINGLQPSYVNSPNNIPTSLSQSDSNFPKTHQTWTISQLTSFIHLSIGAVSLSSSRQNTRDPPMLPVLLPVTALTQKFNRDRVVFLLIPIAFVLAAGFTLSCLTIHLHRQHKIPVMRLATVAEFLKSSQTRFLRDVVGGDAREAGELSGFGEVKVMFGLTRGVGGGTQSLGGDGDGAGNGHGEEEEGEIIAGLSAGIEPFETGDGIAMRRLLGVRETVEEV